MQKKRTVANGEMSEDTFGAHTERARPDRADLAPQGYHSMLDEGRTTIVARTPFPCEASDSHVVPGVIEDGEISASRGERRQLNCYITRRARGVCWNRYHRDKPDVTTVHCQSVAILDMHNERASEAWSVLCVTAAGAD